MICTLAILNIHPLREIYIREENKRNAIQRSRQSVQSFTALPYQYLGAFPDRAPSGGQMKS